MTENFEACWDLSGWRLRHLFNEKLMEEWLKRQEEEEKIKQEEVKWYKDQVSKLVESIDPEYLKVLEETNE